MKDKIWQNIVLLQIYEATVLEKTEGNGADLWNWMGSVLKAKWNIVNVAPRDQTHIFYISCSWTLVPPGNQVSPYLAGDVMEKQGEQREWSMDWSRRQQYEVMFRLM